MSEYFYLFSYLITLVRRRNVTYWCSIHYNLLYSARLLITTAVVVVREAGVSVFKPKQCVSGSALAVVLSCLTADGHKGNVCCAGVGCLMIFSGLWALRSLFPSGVRCRQLQVRSLRCLCCRWPPDDIQRCCLVMCRLLARDYYNDRGGGCSVGNRELWSQRRWSCRFWMRFVGGRLCLFVGVY